MKPAPFVYYRPDTLEECVELFARFGDEANALAGGQSLVPMMNLRLAQPSALIDITGVPELAGIGDGSGAGTLDIGATTRQSEAMTSSDILRRTPLLSEALHHVGHAANRNRGTIGGSAAHADPAAELPAVLLALDAELVVRGPKGQRVIAADAFFRFYFTTALEADEMLCAVRIPAPAPDRGRQVWGFLEVARRRGDFALVGVALAVNEDDTGCVASARIALFGVADRPVRATDAEVLLVGGRLDDPALQREVGERVSSDLDPASDRHASGIYRREVAGVLVRRTLAQANERGALPA